MKNDWKSIAIIFLFVAVFILSALLISRPVVWSPTVPEGYKQVQDDNDKTLVIPNEYYFRIDEKGNMSLVKE